MLQLYAHRKVSVNLQANMSHNSTSYLVKLVKRNCYPGTHCISTFPTFYIVLATIQNEAPTAKSEVGLLLTIPQLIHH